MKQNKRNLSFKNLEIRSSENEGKKYIEGLIPYNSKSVPMWGVTEIIDRTAFNKTLSDKAEVRALWNHDDSLVLGNTKSGSLELDNTNDGLICRCELPNTTYANDLYEIVTRGDVSTMSFGFIPVKWLDNGNQRTLKEVKLDEVSFGVIHAAYPETNSQTYMRGFMKRAIDIESINEILEKEEITEEEITKLQEVINTINSVIEKSKPKEEAVNEEQRLENDTPKNKDTPNDEMLKETDDKEAIKQEIISLIDTLFEIENETPLEEKEETKDE
jgi:HK97 family phage prohead protease